MVLLWHHSEEPFSVPDGTFIVLCAASTAPTGLNLAEAFSFPPAVKTLGSGVALIAAFCIPGKCHPTARLVPILFL